MLELMTALEAMQNDDVIRNYGFRKDEQALTVYVDETETHFIGAILIPVN
jgi:hypothetical protein